MSHRVNRRVIGLCFVLVCLAWSFAPPSAAPNAAPLQARSGGDFRYNVVAKGDARPDGAIKTFEAVNQANRLRLSFSDAGLNVHSAELYEGAWALELTPKELAYGDSVHALRGTGFTGSGNVVNYQFGNIAARYTNTELGIEQTFTVPAPQQGETVSGRVRIAIDLAMTSALKPSQNAYFVDFAGADGGTELRYGALRATDAKGAALKGGIEVTSTADGKAAGLRIVVDAVDPVYPIVVTSTIRTDSAVAAAAGTTTGAASLKGEAAPGTAPAVNATVPGEITGNSFSGGPGVTETVLDLMAREAAAPPPSGEIFVKQEFEAELVLAENPDAPNVSQWPAPTGFAAQPPPPLNPQTIGTNFQTVTLTGFTEAASIPPDPMGDVGPTQILAATNSRIKVFDKVGNVGALNVSDATFWASQTPTTGVSDPEIRYDRLSGRWFVAAVDLATSNNKILLAVSSGPTITGVASFTFFNYRPSVSADQTRFCDYPSLGVDANAVYMGCDFFTTAGAFNRTSAYVVRKSTLLTGTLNVTGFGGIGTLTAGSDGPYAPRGVDNDDPTWTEGYIAGSSVQFLSTLQIRRVINPGSATPTLSGNLTLTVPQNTNMARQWASGVGASTNNLIDVSDARLFMASIHKNKLTGVTSLWTAQEVEVSSTGAALTTPTANDFKRIGARWYEIGNLTGTPSLTQSGTLFSTTAGASSYNSERGYMYPSVAESGQGHMGLGASYSSAAEFVGAAVSGRLRTDTLGTIQAPAIATTGIAAYHLCDGASGACPRNRWGDYSFTDVDPNDDQTIWTFQEVAVASQATTIGNGSWAVRAVKLIAPPPAAPASASPSFVCTGLANTCVTVTGTSASGSEFFDPGPDTGGPGYANHIGATVTGGVTVNAWPTTNIIIPGSPGTTAVTQLNLCVNTTAATPGAKNVTVTNPDGQALTGTGILTVNQTPGATTASNDGPVCEGGTLNLFAVTVPGATYSWTGPAGFLSSAQNPSIVGATPANSGQYNVTVTVGGCTSTTAPTIAAVTPTGGACGDQSTSQCDAANTCGAGGVCQANNTPNGTACSDSNACTTGDACNGAGACVPGGATVCNDGNPCTDDTCDPSTGCVFTNNTSPCDDGSACTSGDTCGGGVCSGTAIVCSDGNVCTTDTCDPSTGCVFTNNTSPCDDGNPCTANDTCGGGSCQPGTPVFCNDNNVCTTDTCDPSSGCVYTNNTAPCDDGNACTSGDTCGGGSCQPGTPVVCDDNKVCTTDTCDPTTGCVYTNNTNPCSDNNACTAGDTCGGGVCNPGTPVVCDDSNPCTTDTCDPSSGCVYTNNTNPCDDGNVCTANDTCGGGACNGTPVVCNDGNVCTTDSCVPGTGCVYVPNTAPCEDGSACTTGDTCGGGLCQPGTPVVCNDNNSCTDDTCNPVSGCVYTPNNANTCTDGNACTADVCVGGACVCPTTNGACQASPATTFNSTDVPKAISTGAANTVTSTLTVSGVGPYLYDVNAKTFITHTSDGQLQITLKSPAGTIVTLSSNNGGTLDNAFNGTLWDDSADPGSQVPYTNALNIATDTVYANLVVKPSLTPEEPLGAFIGENPNGVWTLTIADQTTGDGGNLANWSLDLKTLAAAPAMATTSYPSGDVPKAIADNTAVASLVTVSGAGTQIGRVRLTDFILHTFSADLDITIKSPQGTIVTLTTDNGVGNDNSFNGTVWDDKADPGNQVPYTVPLAASKMVTDTAYTNLVPKPTLTPEEALAAFNGENPNGIWTMTISDDATGDTGTLTSWSLEITTTTCQVTSCAVDCNDNNPCTDDSCDPSTGCVYTPNTASCTDGNACTSGDVCSGGVCSGTPVVCNDNNECTDDSCNPASGQCVYANNTNTCNDGNACTANDQCAVSGTCGSGENFDGVTAPALPSGWTTTASGSAIVWKTVSTSSDTAPNSVFGDDTNTGSGLTPGDELLVSPPIPISSATANLTFRNRWAFESPTSCFDAGVLEIKIGAGAFTDIVAAGGSFVSGGYTGTVSASFGSTLGGRSAWCSTSAGYPAYLTTVVNLPAAAAGQTIQLRWRVGIDTSAGATGQNVDTITITDSCAAHCTGSPVDCDDHNPCTDDSCDPSTGCVHTNNTAPCDDGNPCTLGDTCGGGSCQPGSGTLICNDNNVCTTDTCDPASGCVYTNNTNPCDDGNACTANDTCGGGLCNGTPIVCNDGNICTDDACNPASGCFSIPNTAPCEDGNPCTTGDTCGGGLCQPGAGTLVCDDNNPCTDDTCNPASGCVYTNDDTNTCSDGNACTADVCVGGACVCPTTNGACQGSAASFASTDVPKAISTGAPSTITSTLTVSGVGPFLSDVNLKTFITHTFTGDLQITLKSPAGTIVSISTGNGGGNDNVFNGTLWNDSADPGNQAPFPANTFAASNMVTDTVFTNLVVRPTLTPEEPLGAFIGENPNGVWTLTIADTATGDGGALNNWSLDVTTLAAPPATVTVSYPSPDVPKAIPDVAAVQSLVTVSGAGNQIGRVRLTDFILHTFAADLDITIKSPQGTIVTLTSDNGSGNDNVFNGTVWDDKADPGNQVPYTVPLAASKMVTDTAYTNLVPKPTLTAEEALAAFNGENPNGTWTLTVSDDLGGDTGTLTSWSLEITTTACQVTNCAITCNDNNPCTDDSCDPSTGCVYTPNTATCNDGQACTSGDVCSNGTCAGTPVVCNDGNECTDDSCDPSTGNCVYANNTNICNDGNACTMNDQCAASSTCGGGENFDAATAPALPAGWTTSANGSAIAWVTQSTSSDTAPNSAFGDDTNTGSGLTPGDEFLVSPPIPIVSATAKVTFRNRWSFESPTSCFDAGVLEIKIGAGSFTDILLAGGSFVSGGYTGTVSSSFGSTLAGRSAWCNNSAGYPAYLTTVVNLPAAAAGQTIQLRWRVGIDTSAGATGQNVDTITITDSCAAHCTGSPVDCDDHNPCTDDSCDPSTGCVHTNNTAPCNDGNACTAGDTCGGGVCNPGGPVICNDTNPCTDDSCNPTSGCVYTPNTNACDDGNVCTENDYCSHGICYGGTPLNCDDNNPCTNDSCNPGGCVGAACEVPSGCVHTPNTDPCDDGNACTANDTCGGGTCNPGTPVICNDNNVCTTDTCDPDTGCHYTNNTNPCDDGNVCTTADTCGGGSCHGGPPLNCNDNNPCTDDSCNPTGLGGPSGCVHTPNIAPCNDGNACTTNDTCGGGTCHGGPAPNCDDGNVCTTDSCNPSTGCGHANNTNPCNDGNACTANDTCGGGTCNPGGPVFCDDNNPCTTDSCDSASGCVHTNNTAPCNDGNACTTNDTCGGGTCNGGVPPNCDDGNGCTTDTCNPTSGCVHTNNTNPCDDGNACTTIDTCGGGTCNGGPALNCNDSNPCTDDSCNPSSGCVHTNNTVPCNDGNACTTNDTCGGGTCNGGVPPNCDDGNVCTTDTCNTSSGCVHTNNTAPCSDGNACTTGDTCGGGTCHAGGPTNCDDGQCCTVDSCNPATGCVHVANTAAPVFTTQPSFGNDVIWPPQHGYVDLSVAGTGAAATSSCGIASYQFASCSSSQIENTTGVGDGNTVRDCVYEPSSLHVRAERDGACSPIGRVYTTTVIAVDVCGNQTASNPFDIGVWHDRGHAPAAGTVIAATAGSNTPDTRPGTNGTYGTGCGTGNSSVNGTVADHSDADPDMEVDQYAAIDVNSLGLTKAAGNVTLTWTAPSYAAPINVTRYHVYRLDPITLFWTLVSEVPKTTTSFQDPILNDGHNWQYKVTAVIK